MMKKIRCLWGILAILTAGWLIAPPWVDADLEWTIKKEQTLTITPLDVATSDDGKSIFVLSPGEILVYSDSGDKPTNRIPVDKSFDRLTYSSKNNQLIVTSRSEKTLNVIQLETIHTIDRTGLPLQGPEQAPVTIAIFSDYQ